jgi:ASC-1-like (ASCH) protein
MHDQVFSIDIDQQWLDAIRDGRKTVEGKKNKAPWRYIAAGARVRFVGPPDAAGIREVCLADVTSVAVYEPPDALTKYLLSEGLECTLPGAATLAEGLAVYRGYWPLEGGADPADRHGVLAFRLARR